MSALTAILDALMWLMIGATLATVALLAAPAWLRRALRRRRGRPEGRGDE